MNENGRVVECGKPVHVAQTDFRGKDRLDVREYYARADGDTAPSKKGVNLLLEDGPALVRAMSKVVAGEETSVIVDADLRNPIFVARSDFRGEDRFDLRHYYDADGTWKPTRKGVSVPWAYAQNLLDAVTAVTSASEGVA